MIRKKKGKKKVQGTLANLPRGRRPKSRKKKKKKILVRRLRQVRTSSVCWRQPSTTVVCFSMATTEKKLFIPVPKRPLIHAPKPDAAIACAPGLEYLGLVDQIIIQQQVELLEAIISFETANKYIARNTQGQFIFFLVEESDWCTRCMCPRKRSFSMRVLDIRGREVMTFIRPFRCMGPCCFSGCCACLQEMEIQAPPGATIGYVVEECSLCCPSYAICDRMGTVVLRVQAPFCRISCPCCPDVNFRVQTLGGNDIGTIAKQWSGLAKELFTDADNFGIRFPIDLDVSVKACLLGCTMIIDFMYFETGQVGNPASDVVDLVPIPELPN